MRRENITLDVSNIGWLDTEAEPRQPTLTLRVPEDLETPTDRLETESGRLLEADETDITFRLRDEPQIADATGVVAVTNRLTGEFVLECNAEASDVLSFVRAARRYGESMDGDAVYRVELDTDGETVVTYEKRTFLVYSEAGELLRKHSLIPSGVEI